MTQYDLIVIGAGPGGVEAAALATRRGLKVALVEKDLAGGTCLNRGCVPTKCLCASAERLHEIRSAEDFGIVVGEVTAHYDKAHARAREIVDTLRDDLFSSLADVELIQGEARLGEGNTVFAGCHFMKARRIIIATGSRPAPFPCEGGELAGNSDTFLASAILPGSAVIVGGGVIGLELASIMCEFGTEVTVLEFCREILPGFDSEIARRLNKALSRRGVKIITSAKATRLREASDGRLTLEYEGKKGPAILTAEKVYGAVGRRPVLPNGLAEAGVQLDSRGYIAVDSSFCTSAPGIYAIGDVNGTCMLAHAASAQARIVSGQTDCVGCVPSVVFTIPECASVGLTAESADGLSAVKIPYGANSKAMAAGTVDGFVKIVYNGQRQVVGCQILGAHAADLIGEAAIIIDAGYTIDRLALFTVSAHPGLSELIQQVAASV